MTTITVHRVDYTLTFTGNSAEYDAKGDGTLEVKWENDEEVGRATFADGEWLFVMRKSEPE